MPESKGIVIPFRVCERAYQKWEAADDDADCCFISTYSTASHGYAQIGWQDPGYRNIVLAHRAAWTYVHGQIPEGMTVDHRTTCDRRCVRVTHLRLLTNLENARRTSGRDWPLGQCINGHDDSYWLPKGPTRIKGCCAMCRADNQRRYRKKKAAA